jgi:cytochrome c oxidase subunit 3
MPFIDEIRLGQLATNIQFGRGDFVTKGKYGEDVVVYFKGKKLEYKNRQLMYKGKILSPYLQIKASETSDNASAFLYILTILHLLHVGAALLYLSKLVISSFRNKYSSEDFLSLKLGAIFWHFLGLLWLYLLLFLIFIH